MEPVIDQEADQNIKAGVQIRSDTSGPGDGNPNADQTLTISASSSNTTLLPDPVVTYNSDDFSAALTFDPPTGQTGTATVTVTVQDDGGTLAGGNDTHTHEF